MDDLSESGDSASDEASTGWAEREVLAEAESISHIGSWVLDVGSGQAWWSD